MDLPNRNSIRLPSYDYSNHGYYFITICTHNRNCMFGNIINNNLILNKYGKIINDVLISLPQHHPIKLDIFQIMPNHLHLIIFNNSGIGRNPDSGIARNAPTENDLTKFGHVAAGSLSCVIRSFKSETTKQIRRMIKNPNLIIWQRNYYEHIIRNELELNKIREYIKSNPQMWERDRNNLIIG